MPHPAIDRLRAHPRVVDAVVALLTVPAVLAPGAPPAGREQVVLVARIDGVGTALALLACCLLLARRDAPRTTLAATTALAAAVLAGNPESSQAVLPALVALASLAVRVRLLAVVASALLVTAASVGGLVLGGLEPIDAVQRATLPWTGLAAALGVAVRAQREAVAAALERARQAELTREGEAQRRVAEERLRIARDLHDVVAHQIAVVTVQAGVAGHLLRTDPDGAAAALENVREASGEVMRELPALLGVLRADPGEVTPTPSIREVATLVGAARQAGLEVHLTTTGDPDRLDAGAAVALHRITQEALTNAARHGTGSATLTIEHGTLASTVEVRNPLPRTRTGSADTGAGRGSGLGLTGIRERAAAHGGTASIGPHGDVWTVRVELPHDGRPGDPHASDGAR